MNRIASSSRTFYYLSLKNITLSAENSMYFFQTSNDGNTTTSTLSFTAKKEDSGKNLTCRAENPTVSSEILETTWTLHVHCKSDKY